MPRVLFEKTGNAIWISHLDLMRVFQRAFKRSGIEIRFSQGYSPRAYVSIALPLSVGTASLCEILDFDLAEGFQMPLEEILERLNRTLPAGILAKSIWEQGKKLKELTHLDVDLCLEYDEVAPEDAAERIRTFLLRDGEIIVEKRSKGKLTQQDIRPMILSCEIGECDHKELHLRCRICAQNPSLNPMLIPEAIRNYLPELSPSFAKALRLEVLDPRGEPFR